MAVTLLEAVQRACNYTGNPEPTSVEAATGVTKSLKAWVNEAYKDILRKWKVELEAQIRLKAPVETGTLTNTAGSSSITGTSTTFVTDGVQAGDYIKLSPDKPYYVVADTPTSETALTTTTAIVDAHTTVTYEIVRPFYRLPATHAYTTNILSPRTPKELTRKGWSGFRRLQADRGNFIEIGWPSVYSEYGSDTATGERYLWLWPYPKEAMDLHVFYEARGVTLELDEDTFLIPDDHIDVMVWKALHYYYIYTAKDEARALMAQGHFEAAERDLNSEQLARDAGDLQVYPQATHRINEERRVASGYYRPATDIVQDRY